MNIENNKNDKILMKMPYAPEKDAMYDGGYHDVIPIGLYRIKGTNYYVFDYVDIDGSHRTTLLVNNFGIFSKIPLTNASYDVLFNATLEFSLVYEPLPEVIYCKPGFHTLSIVDGKPQVLMVEQERKEDFDKKPIASAAAAAAPGGTPPIPPTNPPVKKPELPRQLEHYKPVENDEPGEEQTVVSQEKGTLRYYISCSKNGSKVSYNDDFDFYIYEYDDYQVANDYVEHTFRRISSFTLNVDRDFNDKLDMAVRKKIRTLPRNTDSFLVEFDTNYFHYIVCLSNTDEYILGQLRDMEEGFTVGNTMSDLYLNDEIRLPDGFEYATTWTAFNSACSGYENSQILPYNNDLKL